MENSSTAAITKAAGAVGLATFFSRILGFIRDIIIANLFGAKLTADAFFVAFRIPNLIRRLTAEGAMTAAFVPVFTQTREKDGEQSAFSLICNVVTILTVFLVTLTALGVLFAPWVVRVVAPGFSSDPIYFRLTTLLTRIMFPYIVFISVSAILMAALNSMGKFFIPALAPALMNVAIITCALTLYNTFDEHTVALAIGVLIGGLLQLITQLAPLLKLGWRYTPSFNLKDIGTRQVGALMVPAVFGLAVAEVNILVDTALASLLPEGSVSYLYYGNRVVQFPLGVFGAAVGIAALPSMSALVARGAGDKLPELLRHSLTLILFVAIPSTVGLMVLAGPISNVLFERGQFDALAREGTRIAMIYYAIGLVAFSGVKVVVSAFYSMKDTATPTRIAAWSMTLNVVLNIALMIPLKHGGLALATSISSMVNLAALLWLIRKKIGSIGGSALVKSVAVTTGSSAIMGLAVYFYSNLMFSYTESALHRAESLGGAIAVGACVYAVVTLAMGAKEARSVKNRFMSKFIGKR